MAAFLKSLILLCHFIGLLAFPMGEGGGNIDYEYYEYDEVFVGQNFFEKSCVLPEDLGGQGIHFLCFSYLLMTHSQICIRFYS